MQKRAFLRKSGAFCMRKDVFLFTNAAFQLRKHTFLQSNSAVFSYHRQAKTRRVGICKKRLKQKCCFWFREVTKNNVMVQ